MLQAPCVGLRNPVASPPRETPAFRIKYALLENVCYNFDTVQVNN